jgi:peptide/nickel transport system ATP-binding protein
MSNRFCVRWPDFVIATRRGQEVVQYEAGAESFDSCLGVVGHSGAGKSLFARALAGLLPSGLSTPAEFTVERCLPSGAPIRISQDDITYVPQSPASSLPSAITCGELLQEVMGWRPNRGSRLDAAHHLERVGLDPTTLNLQASQLSGGMAQRFAISLALAREPRLLLLDEPTVGLDADNVRRVLDLIRSLLEDRQMGAIVVTHDSRAYEIADQLLVMERRGTAVSLRSGGGEPPR